MNKATFKTLRDESKSENRGPLVVIRNYKEGGKVLTINNGETIEENLAPNTVIQGIFEGSKVFTSAKGKESKEYKIRGEDNTLYMIKACSSLNNPKTGLAAVSEGTLVQLTFRKMTTTKSGNDFAVFEVATADDSI